MQRWYILVYMAPVTRVLFATMLVSDVSVWAQDGKAGADYDTFRVSRLVCVIGNNRAAGDHREGYNGVFRMTAPGADTSVYVPAVAGLNLEHYFDGRPRQAERQVFFEPRHAPMQFRRLSERQAELRQAATPVYGVESRTVFELREPYYLDMTYRAIPRKGDYTGGYLGIFWASYINGPLDKSIYFLQGGATFDKPQWVQFAAQTHGRDSTVLPAGQERTEPAVREDPPTLFRNFSPLRYSEPFYYGRFGDMVLIYMFQPSPYLRFAQSPSGGGRNATGDDTNPAWDFQMVIPDPRPGREYELRMRAVYKPWTGRADVLREVRQWLATR
jgi:hypothetical protein